jgi:hypothetical protein
MSPRQRCSRVPVGHDLRQPSRPPPGAACLPADTLLGGHRHARPGWCPRGGARSPRDPWLDRA